MANKGTILVTGGAGYVGSHICEAIAAAGFDVVVYDNLSNGHRQFAKFGEFMEGDIRDGAQLAQVFAAHKPAGVVHCAALIEVATSLTETATYYDCNVGGAITLVKAAQEAGVGAFVFSSTCAVYGPPQRLPLDETHPLAPISPYGRTKMMVEQVLEDLRTHHAFPAVSLRYFNASGAHWQSEIGEKHTPETHAIPLAILAALGRRNGFKIFGTDYDTPDGTAVRDYIHVLDLADAHVRALEYLLAGGAGDVFNLGTGTGSSVRELVDTISKVSGKPFEVQLAERRPGDPPSLVADSSKAERVLGWTPAHTFQDTIESAWMWHSETERHLFQT